jgi:hypothetical protein
MTKLLSAVERRLDADEYSIAMACPLTGHLENEVDLIVSQQGKTVAAWSVTILLEFRCKGDIEAAADEVVAGLRQRREPTP